jgi:AcrR family transcriptional regulator
MVSRLSPPLQDPLKSRVIHVAQGRFLAEGFQRVSMDDIAEELSVSKKTIYKLFESKDALLAAVIDRMLGDVRRTIEEIMAGPASFTGKLRGFTSFAGTLYARMSPAFLRDMQRIAPVHWDRIEAFRRERILENFARLIRQGIDEGAVRRDLNVRIFQLAHLGAIERILRPSVLAEESFSAKEALEEIMRTFFIGIMTDEARDAYLHETSAG